MANKTKAEIVFIKHVKNKNLKKYKEFLDKTKKDKSIKTILEIKAIRGKLFIHNCFFNLRGGLSNFSVPYFRKKGKLFLFSKKEGIDISEAKFGDGQIDDNDICNCHFRDS